MNKSGYAKYTFAFASDIQKLADEKRIKVASFNTSERKGHRGSYDVLFVRFIVPRPDRDVKEPLDEIEPGLKDEPNEEKNIGLEDESTEERENQDYEV